MKKILFTLTLICSMMFNFTSCKEDQKTAFDLSGYWEGNLQMSYVDLTGQRWHSDNSQLYFNCFFETKGDGYQMDYYQGNSPYSAIFHRFNWDISNGVITITYKEKNMEGFNTTITDYTLEDNIFVGYFGDSKEMFTLRKKSSFDWFASAKNYGLSEYFTRELLTE